MQWQNLYALPHPLTANNYPPLSFYIVGSLGSLLGDHIFAGRIIALVSFFATAVNVAFITARICGNTPAAVFSGIFFIATMAGIYDMYIGADDPQMLGHAFMTTGLAVLVGGETRRRNLFLSALLICTGGFVKHNLVALPVAAALHLLFHHRRSFRFWLAWFVGFLTAGFAAALAAFGFDFISSLNFPRRFTLLRLGKKLLWEPLKLQVPIFFWLIYSAVSLTEKYTVLIGAYVLVAAVTAIGFSGGDGVTINVFFDLVIGLSITVGLGLHRANEMLSEGDSSPLTRLRVMTVLSLALCLGIVIHVPGEAFRLSTIVPQLSSVESETLADIDYLEGHPGPVLCESLSLCYSAGKEIEVDTFYARQSFLTGTQSEADLLAKVRAGYFDVIQLMSWEPDRDDERMSPVFVQTVTRCYRIDRISANGAFFTPGPKKCDPTASESPDPTELEVSRVY
jgi:hypothetical protein